MFPDFSAPKTQAWWSTLVATSASLGIRGMWIDMNEPSSFVTGTVPDDVKTADGARTMAEVHNADAWLEAKATYEGMIAARPDERPFVLSRAAFAGQQRYSAVWTGDAPSDFPTLEGTLPQLLHLGLSGMAFAGSDVGGYSGRAESTADLFARWMALGAISPFFRAHAEQNARRQEPWAFGEATLDATRAHVRERYALFPYLYSAFEETARTGAPVLRPLFFDHDATQAPTADVEVAIRVRLPAGSPTTTAIHVASSHGGWAHVPIVRSIDGSEATGTVRAPRGGWVFYKVTRGNWPTVEKSSACAEIDDRAAFGSTRGVDITVARWADQCP